MPKIIAGIVYVGMALVLFAPMAASNSRTDDSLGVAVSPQTLILGADQGGEVKAHTAIPLSSVDRSSVKLNGIPTIGIGVDALGNLVAIFDEAEIKGIVSPPAAELTLTGVYLGGGAFAGSDTVSVIVKRR